jgi:pantoate--beta-alanine ligase
MSDTSAQLPVVRTVAELRQVVAGWRAAGLRIGFVPTMGALHDGHLSLVRQGKERADRVVASVFVNPTQFAPTEDLDRYPRQETKDATLLASAGCDLLFAPSPAEIYPPGFATSVTVSGVTDDLEGRFRPQMFGGVALVVAKLFNMVQADVALFGEKDFQQLLVIRRMARDLDIPVEVVGCPTVREADGLAMSSRNAYLSAAERATAASLSRVLGEVVLRARNGEDLTALEAWGAEALLEAGFAKVDYLAIRSQEDLSRVRQPLRREHEHTPAGARVLAAAWLGSTRLIDNVPV